jgi:hypothetical protein
MGKAKREAKRARRAARGTEQERTFVEAEHLQVRRLRRRRVVLATVPVVTALAGAGLYWGMDNGRAAGVVLLLGILVFFLLGLSTLGATVQPRDRDRAGSIDFGNRR